MSFEDPTASRLFANEIIGGAPFLTEYMQQILGPWVESRADIIRGWIADGRMPETDPVLLIFMIWSSTQHYADFQAQVLGLLGTPCYDEATMTRIADFLSHTLLKGCGLKPTGTH